MIPNIFSHFLVPKQRYKVEPPIPDSELRQQSQEETEESSSKENNSAADPDQPCKSTSLLPNRGKEVDLVLAIQADDRAPGGIVALVGYKDGEHEMVPTSILIDYAPNVFHFFTYVLYVYLYSYL